MEKTNKFIQFFTDKEFRQNQWKIFKFRFSMLPGIRHVLSWWFAIRFALKIKDLGSWDQYVAEKSLEMASKKTILMCALIRLYAYLAAEDESRKDEDFYTTQKEVLECEYWKELPELADFKKWISEITPKERNADKVLDVLKKYNKPE